MLGRLEMNIDDCIESFTRMMDKTFEQRHRLPFKLFGGQVQPRYDTDVLEKSIKIVIHSAGFDPDEKLRGKKSSNCKVFALSSPDSWLLLTHGDSGLWSP
jgi:calcium-independent phospholipase A2-gamma